MYEYGTRLKRLDFYNSISMKEFSNLSILSSWELLQLTDMQCLGYTEIKNYNLCVPIYKFEKIVALMMHVSFITNEAL